MPIPNFAEGTTSADAKAGCPAGQTAATAAGVQSSLPIGQLLSATPRWITLTIAMPAGNYQDTCTYDFHAKGNLRKWNEFLLSRRKRLGSKSYAIGGIGLPWEKKLVVFDPPLASVLPSAYLGSAGEIRCS